MKEREGWVDMGLDDEPYVERKGRGNSEHLRVFKGPSGCAEPQRVRVQPIDPERERVHIATWRDGEASVSVPAQWIGKPVRVTVIE